MKSFSIFLLLMSTSNRLIENSSAKELSTKESDRKLLKSPKIQTEKVRSASASILSNEPPILDIWIFEGFDTQPYRLFSSVELQLNLSDAKNQHGNGVLNYEIYQSANRSALFEEQADNRRFFGIFRKVVLWKSRQIPPFHKTFVGIETEEPYEICVKITSVDYIRFGIFVAGIALFFFAKRLARNAVFYYTSGASVGVLASLLIAVFFVYRFLPKRSIGLSVLIGGWSFSLYLLYSLWQNLYNVLLEYQKLAAGYLVTVLLISFGICYRFGPLTDPRSQNLSQWALQLVGMVLMYVSCQITDITLAVWLVMLTAYNMPASVLRFFAQIMYRLRPPKRRLLTEEEYMKEGTEYTKKALEELKQYCRSPKCDPWKITTQLESPTRFASFISGGSHLEDDELLNFDNTDHSLLLNPDFDSDDSDEILTERASGQDATTSDDDDNYSNFVTEKSRRFALNGEVKSRREDPELELSLNDKKSASRRNPHVSRVFHSEGRNRSWRSTALANGRPNRDDRLNRSMYSEYLQSNGAAVRSETTPGENFVAKHANLSLREVEREGNSRSFGETPKSAEKKWRRGLRRSSRGFRRRWKERIDSSPPDTVSSDEDASS